MYARNKHFINIIHSSKSEPQGYRVWDASRQTKLGIVASTLQELKQRARDRLGCHLHESCDLTLVLESCGTKVSEESYFQQLSAQTTFLLLKPSEKWQPANNGGSSSTTKMEDFISKLDTLTSQLSQEMAASCHPMKTDL